MKNILIALFGLALIGGVLAGCSPAAPAEGGTTATTGTEGAAPAATTEEAK